MFMKKVLILVLAVVMVISLAIPAVAAAKPGTEWESQAPELAEGFSETVVLHSAEDALKLAEEIQKLMNEAKAKLKDACPEGFNIKYFSYMELADSKNSGSVTVEPIDHYEIVFMQYVDGAWVEREHTVNGDVTITIGGVVEAPLAVFTKDIVGTNAGGSYGSAAAKRGNLLPGLGQGYTETVLLHSTEDVLELAEEIQRLMTEAKAKLKDACPEGFAVKYFYYTQLIDSEGPVEVGFKKIAHDEIMFMQYVDGAWVALEVTVNEDATITVDGVVEAPMAIFIE